MPQAFEDMFAAVDRDGDGYLSLGDLWALIGRNKMVADFFGVSYRFRSTGSARKLLV